MKNLFTILVAGLLTTSVFAQIPQKLSYQAVIRNSSNTLVTNTKLGMRISILQGLISGTVVYTETQTPSTNANGLVSIEIGGGAGFSTIDWSSGSYFIKTETDPTGGNNYTITGTSQLLSVPYALYATKAGNVDALLAQIEQLQQKTGLIVKDIDNNTYHTVTIGTQTWMVENLRVTHYNDGTNIPNVTDNTWTALTTGAYCWYENDYEAYGKIYGALYNWYAVNTGKLAPVGWHVPSDAEWTTLTDYLGGATFVAGCKLMEAGTAHWNTPRDGVIVTNESGFTALPGGILYTNNIFYNIGSQGCWWSTTEDDSNYARNRFIDSWYGAVGSFTQDFKYFGQSVRCVKDNGLPSVTTISVTSIAKNSANSGVVINDKGVYGIIFSGVCWSYLHNPTISDYKTTFVNSSNTGYCQMVDGLMANTTYYVRAYATTSAGTVYGNELSFTTSN